jgi:hypothetical protein
MLRRKGFFAFFWAATPGFSSKMIVKRGNTSNFVVVGGPYVQKKLPKVAAILSIVESCRRLGLPIREYLAAVLPGLADRPVKSLDQLTPAAYAAIKAK